DYARTRSRWLQEHLTRAEATQHLMGDGAADHGHLEQVLPSLFIALADRFGHLVRLAETDPDVAFFVTDHDERGEAEPATAFDHLGHPVDVDDSLFELVVVEAFKCHVASLRTGARPRVPP